LFLLVLVEGRIGKTERKEDFLNKKTWKPKTERELKKKKKKKNNKNVTRQKREKPKKKTNGDNLHYFILAMISNVTMLRSPQFQRS